MHATRPHRLWLRGAVDIGRWHLGPGIGCRGSRLVPVTADGLPAFGSYRPSGPDGRLEPFSIQVIEASCSSIASCGSATSSSTLGCVPVVTVARVLIHRHAAERSR